MLNLNSRSFLSNSVGLCTLCNMKALANILHFIGVCPVYNSIRFKYFGSVHLEEDDVIHLQNGTECFASKKSCGISASLSLQARSSSCIRRIGSR